MSVSIPMKSTGNESTLLCIKLSDVCLVLFGQNQNELLVKVTPSSINSMGKSLPYFQNPTH